MSKTRAIHRQRPTAAQVRDTTRLVRKTVIDALLRAGLAADSDHAPLRLAPAPSATAPTQMAAAQSDDAAAQRELAASYQRCLQSYRELRRTQQPDSSDDDLGAVVAFFVGVNLHALHGVAVDAQVLQPLERQLRGVAWRASQWDTAPLPQRQAFFERLAILSVVVSGSHASAAAQGPTAVANVRRSAHQYLQQLLGFDPDLLTLEATGLAARESVADAAQPA